MNESWMRHFVKKRLNILRMLKATMNCMTMICCQVGLIYKITKYIYMTKILHFIKWDTIAILWNFASIVTNNIQWWNCKWKIICIIWTKFLLLLYCYKIFSTTIRIFQFIYSDIVWLLTNYILLLICKITCIGFQTNFAFSQWWPCIKSHKYTKLFWFIMKEACYQRL